MDKKENVTNETGNLIKKYLKKPWVIVLIVLILLIIIFNIASGIKNRVDWNSIELNDQLPKIKDGVLELISNSDSYLSIHVKKIKKSDYKNYVKECQKKGFEIDVQEDSSHFEAFNKEGYELNIYYFDYDDEYSLSLNKPYDLEDIEWPDKGISTKIPKISSTKGIISLDSSDEFNAIIGNVSYDDYKKYVKSCDENGFNIDYKNEKTNYYAKNSDGDELIVEYLGGNNIKIVLKSKDGEEIIEDDKPEVEEEPKEDNETSKQEEEKPKEEDTTLEEPKKSSVYYSTNDKDTVKNGNTGVYAYKDRGTLYNNYYIIDFDEGFVYFFADGNGDETCTKVKMTSGNLNSVLIITYNDGNSTWQEGLRFKYKNQPDHLVLEDNDHFEFDFYATNLQEALKIRSQKNIYNY